MKIVLILFMCSMKTGACLPGYEWPVTFNNPYSCSIAGYEEAARKLKEIGREEVNKHQISITFMCKEIAEI
jgi:hypothetical protein